MTKSDEITLPIIESIKQLSLRLNAVEAIKEKINTCPVEKTPKLCCSDIDYDNLPHAEVVKLIQHFPGKWKKEAAADGKTVNYILDCGEYNIRAYHGEPPPSCRVIEEEVYVPERLVPAHKEVRRKIVCTQPIEEAPL